MADPEWSKKPTVPGAYWWCIDGCKEIVELDYDPERYDQARRAGEELYQFEPGIARAVPLYKKDGCWYGPLDYPVDPPDELRD